MKTSLLALLLLICTVAISACSTEMEDEKEMETTTEATTIAATEKMEDLSEIYLAGGCFWGLEAYLKKFPGVNDVEVGYANGNTENPTYEDVCNNNTGHAEVVRVLYDHQRLPLDMLLKAYFKVIDPTSLNQQGYDIGVQYRTGIYYVNQDDRSIIDQSMEVLKKSYEQPIQTEVLPLDNYYTAEEYHQDYLRKNPEGYCHIDLREANQFIKENNLGARDLRELVQP